MWLVHRVNVRLPIELEMSVVLIGIQKGAFYIRFGTAVYRSFNELFCKNGRDGVTA